MRATALAFPLLFCAGITGGCATGGEAGGGDHNLPNAGFAPWAVEGTDAGPTAVIEDTDASVYRAPFAVAEGGDSVAVYVAVCPPFGVEGVCHIARQTSEDGIHFEAPVPVLESAMSPSDPAVSGEWLYVAIDGGGGLARARRSGASFGEPEPILRAEDGEKLGAPSVVGERIFFERTADDVTVVEWGLLTGDTVVRKGLALRPGTDCGEKACWDAGGIADPQVRRTTSALGRTGYRMVYTGLPASGSGVAIGVAHSDNGEDWVPYAFNPVLDKTGDEREPSVIRRADAFVMYYTRGRRPRGIGVAINAAGHPSIESSDD